jgi:DeoR family ulaG and ulaABCDEF operon transcriptional repressor
LDHQERHKRVLKLLAESGTATVPQLVDWLGVSVATIRRDLRLLDAAQHLRRTRGGARRVESKGAPRLRSTSFHANMSHNVERKRAIARRAVELCADGDTVLIGGGTTTFQMVDFMAGRRMRVMTNSFELARHSIATCDNEVILAGGKIYPEQGVILSPFEREAMQYCYANHLFMGVHCLSSLGMMEADPLLIQAGHRLIPQAQQVTVLADSSKFASKGGMFLCSLDKIACVITDTDAPDAGVQMLERAGVQVLLVEPDAESQRLTLIPSIPVSARRKRPY